VGHPPSCRLSDPPRWAPGAGRSTVPRGRSVYSRGPGHLGESALRIEQTWGSMHARMRVVCAWCGITVTEGEPGDTQVSHGICSECSRRFFPTGFRYAVVPPDRSFLFTEIEGAFRAIRGIRVILDRRRSERRRRCTRVRDDRRAPRRDRRQSASPIVGALPAVAGLCVPCGRPLAMGLSGNSPRPSEAASAWRLPSRPEQPPERP
jgi:hypothetical protein